MLRSRLAAATVPCPLVIAQQSVAPEPVPAAVRHAGVYHVATGTWTRHAGGTAGLGPDTNYRDDAPSGYFTTMGSAMATSDDSITDGGRLPTVGGAIAGAERETSEGNGVEFGYCSDVAGLNVGITFHFDGSYAPCDSVTSPQAPLHRAGSVRAIGLPGGSSSGAPCWTITLDLAGGFELCMRGDGGPAFPGEDLDLDRDAFGMEWTSSGNAGSSTGPLISGDPDWTHQEPGSLLGGGGGRYYASAGASCADMGLDSYDNDRLGGSSPLGSGCYSSFGGCKNLNGCGGPTSTPLASFQSVLFATDADCGGPGLSCDPASVHSSGTPVDLVASPSGVGAGLHLVASGGPPGFFAYFLVSSGVTSSIPLDDGILCWNGPQGRYSPSAGGSRSSLGPFDGSGVLQNLAGTATTGIGLDLPTALPSPLGGSIASGSTWYCQLWYRDANPGRR